MPVLSAVGYLSIQSHASAVAQGNVVRAMSASYEKSLYSTLRLERSQCHISYPLRVGDDE
jgi:hypothetical protein